MLKKEMQQAVKDTMAIIIHEQTGQALAEVKKWLNTVNTAEDFFGTNKQGLAEYNNFIKSRENSYNNAVRRKIKATV